MKSQDVQEKTFLGTKWREGYEIDQVDSLLARVRQTLVAYEEGRAATGEVVTTDDVVHARFNQTKFRAGYDQNQVDDFLDKVAVTLREYEAH
ncbi:DivIVA domain-containing protein [Herbiconiux sp. VKM Ac-2851]|uniref:DivIVA domain-containing protein n=1 Tax=Herbiconiux sp. VKM Ac-2851 TaxID=2739025 RepID=UPI0015657EC4|nr:DivIVA domain-containing protein [Herbiconiux sp. VKM Ac-2851]